MGEIVVTVPFCDGEEIFDCKLKTPAVKLTGKSGVRDGADMVEVEFQDYEPTFFRKKERVRQIFVAKKNIIFVTPFPG